MESFSGIRGKIEGLDQKKYFVAKFDEISGKNRMKRMIENFWVDFLENLQIKNNFI